MSVVSLSGVAKIHAGGRLRLTGKDFVSSGFPAFGAGGINGYLNSPEYTNTNAVILSSIGARCGKCFLAQGSWTSLANTQVIIPDESRVDPQFLWYQLDDERRWIRSGSAQPFIKPSDVKSRRIYLPPLPEQKRIAAILDKADLIRTKRRQILGHLDALTQSIFHQMFGDPQLWPTMWPVVEIGERAVAVDYGTAAKAGQDGEWPVLRMGNVTDEGRLDLSDLKFLELTDAEVSKYSTLRGDLLFNRTNSLDKVGKAAVVRTDRKLAIAGYLVRVRFSEIHESEFVSAFLRSEYGRALRLKLAKAAVNQANISAGEFKRIKLGWPPRELQASFSAVLNGIESVRTELEMLNTVDGTLFASLQSRAFKGEL